MACSIGLSWLLSISSMAYLDIASNWPYKHMTTCKYELKQKTLFFHTVNKVGETAAIRMSEDVAFRRRMRVESDSRRKGPDCELASFGGTNDTRPKILSVTLTKAAPSKW
jgi:hypothetical protein